MPKWIASLIGKYVGKKLKLEERMDDKKPWYKSKTLWSGIVAVLIAGYNAASTQFGIPAIPEWVFALLGAIGVYGRATADTKLTS